MRTNYSKTTYFTILCLFLFFTFTLKAQSGRVISGNVQDETGLPLIGVSIIEKGTTNGSITDVEGNYKIKLSSDKSVLRFLYLGYEPQEIAVNNMAVIPVTMTISAKALNEIVVTGYGQTVSRDKLTAAISKVSSETLDKSVRSNAATALAGAVTGVRITQITGQPGTAPSIQIRGGASLNGTGTPLYIIDGVQKDDLSDLNSNDIESIEILKDAAATALYGARANNGVVLVTSKSGKRGKAEVTLKTNIGQNFLRQTNDFLNAQDFLYWTRIGAQRSNMTQLLTNAGPFGTGNNINADGNVTSAGQYSTMYRSAITDEKWTELQSKGWQLMQDPVWDGTNPDTQYLIFKEFNVRDASLQEAWTKDYTLSVSGGNDKGKYYSSLGYYTEDGFPLESNYNRLSFNLNGEYKIRDWLTNNSFVNFSKSKINDNPITTDLNFFGRMFSAPPTLREYNNDGELIATVGNYADGNMAAQIDKFYRRDETYKTTLGTSLKIDFTKKLYLKLNAIWYITNNEQEFFNKRFLKSPGVYDETRKASVSYTRSLNQTYNAILGYKNSIGKNNINAVAGFEFIDKYKFYFAASGQDATSDDFINLQYTNAIVNVAGGETTRSMSTTHTQERIMSSFINANYDYDSRYLVSFSGRLDGYSRLVNNKFGFFPGISFGWNINREEFMSEYNDIIDNLKLRVGYGQNGNVNLLSGIYDLLGNYANPGNYKGEYGFLINKLPYPDLRWEKTTSFDIGTDFAFLDKIRGSLGVYNKLTTDLLATVSFPTSAGVGTMLTNNGSVRTRGFEGEVKYKIVETKDFTWEAGINLTYQRSKIISLPDNGNTNNRQGGQQVWNPNNTTELIWVGGYQEGQEYGAIYTYNAVQIIRDEADLEKYADYVDMFTTKPVYGPNAYANLNASQKAQAQQLAPGDVVWQDVNGDNIINSYDQVKIGNLIPRIMGGFNTTISWKNLSLYGNFDFAGGYMQFNNRLSWYLGMKQGTYNTVKEVWQTWSENNRNAQYPIYQYADQNYKQNYRESSLFYEKSDYICAREISLSYDIPSKITDKIKIQKLSFSLSGQNLFYLTTSKLYTPEYGASKEGGYPIPRTFLLGAKITF